MIYLARGNPAPYPAVYPAPVNSLLEPRPFLGAGCGARAHEKREERDPFGQRSSPLPQKDTAISIELPVPTTESEVDEHNQAVCRRGADRVCYRKSCARCSNSERFNPHDVRKRGLRLLVEHALLHMPCVICMTVWLARWKCAQCGLVFTDYPDFRTPL